MNQNSKINLLNFDPEAMKSFVIAEGQSAFRATQLTKWIHQHFISDFSDMSNISKSFQALLNKKAEINAPTISTEHISSDGTIKWLMKVDDGNAVETVYIPEAKRATLCISSQVGCTLNCSFCATGKQGFNRNLSTAEIIGQLWRANAVLKEQFPDNQPITNVVMMGMGEPLYNYDHVVSALKLMLDDNAYMLSKKRVTVSTAGVLPKMEALKETVDVAMALSLHAPNNELRNVLVPLNKKYNIEALMEVCKSYFPKGSKRKVLMEYILLKDVNDTAEHARQLVKLLNNIPCKVNLIPYNPVFGLQYERSDETRILAFQNILMKHGIRTLMRKTRGDDITAACGQLKGTVQDKTIRSKKFKQQAA